METVILWVCTLFVGGTLLLVGRDDWRRLRGQDRRVLAQVVRYRSTLDSDNKSYAAIYRFTDDRGDAQEVQDELYSAKPHPEVGTVVELHYPAGRPDLARQARPGIRLLVYATLISFLAILVALLNGWIRN